MATGDGGDCQPPSKKVKTTDKLDIFTSFHEDCLPVLANAVRTFDCVNSGLGFGVVKIKICNALSSKTFSHATCDGEELRMPGATFTGYKIITEAFDIRGLFQYGFKILDSYIQSPECIPRRKGARLALAKLLKFLTELEPVGKILSGTKDETDLTATVAHHLLSKLAVSSCYKLDNFSKGRSKDLCCNCGCNEKLCGEYGDTSMGVPSYWHGRVDILMDVPVVIATEEPDSLGAGNPSIEMTTSSDRMSACKEQIRAKTIVFSFLQKKTHPELNNFLIPTIAMCNSKVAICFYDSENDIFLETSLLDLFVGRIMKIETIIILWLALNYRYCCSGVPEEIFELDFTADFFKHADSDLEKYNSDVTAPCNYQTENTWLDTPFFKKITEIDDDINNIKQLS